MNPLNWTSLYRKFRGKWVALKGDQKTVVGSGPTLKGALEAAQKNGYADPILTRVPNVLRNFVGCNIS